MIAPIARCLEIARERDRLRAALADVMDQLVGVGIADIDVIEGQWHGTEGLDFNEAWGALKDTAA
jgi:hypothetical protein